MYKRQDLTVRITPKQTRDMTLFTAGRPSSLSPDDLRRITPYFDLDSQAFSLDPVPGGAAYTPVSYTHLDVYKRQPAGRS